MASISFLPVTAYFIRLLIRNKLNEAKKNRARELKEQDYVKEMMYKQKIKEIWEKERKPYYEEARCLFNQLMKAGKLSHDQIMYLRRQLENALGEKVHDYDDFTHEVKFKGKTVRRKGFANDAHRIYSYMKNYCVDVNSWKTIIGFLKQCSN